jgi:hypothetical protein
VTAFIRAAPYERTEARRDHRNGYYTRNLETSVGQIAELPVQRTRGGYQTQVFERYHRRREEVERALGEMLVPTLSPRKCGSCDIIAGGTWEGSCRIRKMCEHHIAYHGQLSFVLSANEHSIVRNGARSARCRILLLDVLDTPNLSIDQPYLDPVWVRSGVGQNVLDDSSGQFSCSLVLLEDD